MGDGTRSRMVALATAHRPITVAKPANGRSRRSSRSWFMRSTLRALDREPERVLLGLLRVEGDAVEQRLRGVVRAAVLGAELLHRLLVEVGAHHGVGDAGVVGRALDHAPAAELAEEPGRVLLLRVVAVA